MCVFVGGRVCVPQGCFGLSAPPQHAAVQTQEAVNDAQRAVQGGGQQGEEGQPRPPRREREQDVTAEREEEQPHQVQGLQGPQQGPPAERGYDYCIYSNAPIKCQLYYE